MTDEPNTNVINAARDLQASVERVERARMELRASRSDEAAIHAANELCAGLVQAEQALANYKTAVTIHGAP